MPDSHKGGVITKEMYDNYHNKLYPNILKQVNEYILPTAKANGELHLGLGFNLKTDDPDQDVRTLNNALNQFWSILTVLVINKMHQAIDDNDLQDDVKIVSNIYDSIYIEVRKCANTIKFVNDHIIKYMLTDFVVDQLVHNEAECDIGYDWATMFKIKNNASVEDIKQVMDKLDE
jgi:hypothetical protein